jgi:hypothetical protein
MLSLAATIENGPEEYDERVRFLALYPLRFFVLRSSKPTIISPTR